MIYLTLDIGGSAIKYGLIDDSMTFLEKGSIPAPTENKEQFLDSIYSFYEKYKSIWWTYSCNSLYIRMYNLICYW